MLFENVPANMKHVAGPTLEFEIGTLRTAKLVSLIWCLPRRRREK